MKSAAQIDLVGLGLDEMEELSEELGEPRYRGRQLFSWVYAHRTPSFDEMRNLPRQFREKLEHTARLSGLPLVTSFRSATDSTTKLLFELPDLYRIESVIIPPHSAFWPAAPADDGEPEEGRRLTLCVSTQVGCPLGCSFCATGTMGFHRNLTAGEIVQQILAAERVAGRHITNVVYMGMGEPLLNYDNVVKSAAILTAEGGLGISARHITVSTVGYPDRIIRLAGESVKVKLALSFHSADNAVRGRLMPIGRKYSVEALRDALQEYYRRTRRRVTLEYIMLKGINDREEDARTLGAFSRSVPSKVNLIPFHPIDFAGVTGFAAALQTTPPERIERFAERLRSAGLTVMIRASAGEDINAACGQLAVTEKRKAAL